MSIYQPYTYLIGWSNHNKYYYGVRFAKGCRPDDLWNTYFTSSKYVSEMREEVGEPDVIQIRKTFDDDNTAREWESKVLQRMRVVNSEKWLNKMDGKSIPSLSGENNPSYNSRHKHIKERPCEYCNEIMSKNGIKPSRYEKMKYCNVSCYGEAMKGKTITEEQKKKTSNTIKKKWKEKGSTWKLTETQKENLCKVFQNRPKITCPHCDKTGDKANMKRWHFDNCKWKK